MFRNLRLVYITTPTKDEAKSIARALLEQKLVACANIIDGMTSLYEWEGEIKEESECILLLKAPYHNIARITKRVKSIHSADVPCVVSLTLTEQEGNEAFLDWILQQAPHSEYEIRSADDFQY
jgi:periplasmic divalent cation tolerance protein